MSSNVQELISRIKAEGLEEARRQSSAVEAEARRKAAEIIAEAQSQAAAIVERAQDEAVKLDAATRLGLEQAARNVVLALRQDILGLLGRLVAQDVAQALTTDRLAAMIEAVARQAAGAVQIVLNEEDLSVLKKGVLSRLQNEMKKGVTFAPRSGRTKGLTISFDGNRSCFDLTETALAEYFAGFVSDEVARLIRK